MCSEPYVECGDCILEKASDYFLGSMTRRRGTVDDVFFCEFVFGLKTGWFLLPVEGLDGMFAGAGAEATTGSGLSVDSIMLRRSLLPF